jgi:L-aminopeptidase/D-esterase-like protein
VPGGVGSATATTDDGALVGALAVVNALGNVHDPDDGRLLAGSTAPPAPRRRWFGHTTLVVLATDAELAPAGCTALARVAHDGLARTIRPAHTAYDGDIVFALSVGSASRRAAPVGLAVAAVQAVAEAIVRAVRPGGRA